MDKILQLKKIGCFGDFVNELRVAGMSIGGENNEKVFSLSSYFDESIKWHTDDRETDPWEWRIRVLDECDDIAYGKFFFKKSGYITKEWYPYFYAARRNGQDFGVEYEDGKITYFGKRIYELLCENDCLPLHIIKELGGFGKEDKSKFDRAITELQMKMYITMCGRANKISKKGEEYGWSSTVFCKVENFFGTEVFEKAGQMTREEAVCKIEEQVYRLNRDADQKRVKKFITG